MKYFGGCDVGSTYTKAVILDENGKMCADTTIRSKINAEQSAIAAMEEVCSKVGLKDSKDLAYLIGTGYGRNKVPFADENISEISCHAMGVHVTNPEVRAIIDIGGQDVKGISIDTDGTVKSFAMNDKCSAGTGRFFEAMARSFEMSLPEFSNLSLSAKNVIPITAQCTVFAESEVITLVGEGKPTDEIAAGIEMAVLRTAPKEMYQASLITTAGGKNAGDVLEGTSWTDIDNETFLTMNPDVIVIPTDNFAVSSPDYTAEDVLNNATFADVTAVKNGAVYQMPVGFEAWDSPVPSGILGTLWMLHTLHPELYTAEQFAADADEFYSTFYGFHVALDQAA